MFFQWPGVMTSEQDTICALKELGSWNDWNEGERVKNGKGKNGKDADSSWIKVHTFLQRANKSSPFILHTFSQKVFSVPNKNGDNGALKKATSDLLQTRNKPKQQFASVVSNGGPIPFSNLLFTELLEATMPWSLSEDSGTGTRLNSKQSQDWLYLAL